MWTTCFLTLLLVLSAQAIEVTETLSSTLVTSLQCVTRKGSSSAPIPLPTSTTTERLPPDVIIGLQFSKPVTTLTLPGLTLTSTVLTSTTVTITATATTDTFSSTSTVIASVTSTVTSTFTETDTVSISTSTTSTSLIPAPSGFQPVYDTAGETTLQGPPANRRRELDPVLHGEALLQRSSRGSANPNSNKYPSSVLCVDYIQAQWVEEIIVIVGKTSTSTVLSAPQTTTVTSTVTSTSTDVPEVSTTLTTTTTTTSTSISTSIATVVTTSTSTIVFTSTATAYAACATNNQLGPQIANGSYTNYGPLLVNNEYEYAYVINSKSAYDCCVSCVTEQYADNCQISIFQPDGASGTCEILGQPPGQDNPALCNNPGLSVIGIEYTAEPSEFSPIIFSNGPCGVAVSQ